MARPAKILLMDTTLVVRRGPFCLGSWPRAQDSAVFAGVIRTQDDVCLAIRDDRETTALLREGSLPTLPAPRRIERGFSVLTLDMPMEWDVVGVLAAVSSTLSAADIPLGAFSAYARDHLLVPLRNVEDAAGMLEPMVADVVWHA